MEPSSVADPAERALASSELDPLLAPANDVRTRAPRKRFYRPRPLWLVPFAITAALVRGMTLAPRVQVFTQLSCAQVYAGYNTTDGIIHSSLSTLNYSSVPATELPPSSAVSVTQEQASLYHRVPHDKCLADPAVQAGAARLQTTFMIVMGITSTLSTGWWGQFGEKHGRTKILTLATLGLFFSDLTFIIVSNPRSRFGPQYGHILLALAPFFEGILGGWASLQGATVAYLSDCTSDGKSRARVFSRFNGVFYLGFSVGPTLGAYFIRHPIIDVGSSDLNGRSSQNITSVFYVAAGLSLLNMFLLLFVFPESLHSKKPPPVLAEGVPTKSTWREFADGFKHVFTVFSPRTVEINGKTRIDRNLTFLAAGLFFYLLGLGVFQIKYLYAEHVYGWESEQLSYYIFLAGGLRALALLVVLPWIISTFKPKPKVIAGGITAAAATGVAAPSAAQRARETHFDLTTTRLSLLVDVTSHALVSLAPLHGPGAQGMFVGFSVLSSMAAGVLPTAQSLALGLVKAHDAHDGHDGTGRLFGAIGALQAASSMILGPLLFGVIYARTVAVHPKAIFNVACGIILIAFVLMCCVRAPTPPTKAKSAKKQRRNGVVAAVVEEPPRGRSRHTKDLRPGVPSVRPPMRYESYSATAKGGSMSQSGSEGSIIVSPTSHVIVSSPLVTSPVASGSGSATYRG